MKGGREGGQYRGSEGREGGKESKRDTIRDQCSSARSHSNVPLLQLHTHVLYQSKHL